MKSKEHSGMIHLGSQRSVEAELVVLVPSPLLPSPLLQVAPVTLAILYLCLGCLSVSYQ